MTDSGIETLLTDAVAEVAARRMRRPVRP